MSWDVKESWQGDQTGVTVAENGNQGTTDVTRVFTAVADQAGYRTIDALLAPGVPRKNDPYPTNFALRARRFSVVNEGPLYFIITVSYTANVSDPNDESQNPLALPAEVEFTDVTQEVEIDEALEVNPPRPLVGDGYPIETINGEPIRGVTQPFTDLAFTIQRNLPTFDPSSISEYTNKVNSTPFLGCPAGTVRIMGIKASSVFSEGFAYWNVSITFQVRRGRGPVPDERAWWFRTAHQGYKVRVSNNAPITIAKTSDNQTVTQPVMIDLVTGVQLPEGTGAFIEFRVFDEIDFNQLSLL
jgi:hypothetical protein